MEVVLPHLEPWQKEVFDEVEGARGTGRIFVVKSKRQVGKTIVAIVLLIKYLLEKKCICAVVEPTQAQSRRVFKQIEGCIPAAIKSANSTLLTMEFINGSELIFKSAEQREALRGFTVNGLLVIDEAAFISSDIINILYPLCDANNAPILFISTPLFQSGEFYNLYVKGNEGNPNIRSFNWSKYDTSKYLSAEKLAFYKSTVSPLKFQSEYLGEFIAEGSYIFGDIFQCVGEMSDKPAIYAGIDWATGNGGDWTVCILMDEDKRVCGIKSFKNLDATEQIDQLVSLINGLPRLRTVQVELNSIGRVFYDHLRKRVNPYVKGFVTSNDSKRNIIETLITAFQKKEITIPNDPELIRELQHYSMEKTQKGYTYNGADGVNDDYCIALGLCYNLYKNNNNDFRLVFR